SRAWRGVRRRAIWAAGTAISAGAPRRGAATSASLPTILVFSFCLGFAFRIWRRTFSAAWQRHFLTIGAECTGTRFTSRKPSLTPDVFAEPVTARRTGNYSE